MTLSIRSFAFASLSGVNSFLNVLKWKDAAVLFAQHRQVGWFNAGQYVQVGTVTLAVCTMATDAMLREILLAGILCARKRSSGEKKREAEHERHRRAIFRPKSITAPHQRAPK